MYLIDFVNVLFLALSQSLPEHRNIPLYCLLSLCCWSVQHIDDVTYSSL